MQFLLCVARSLQYGQSVILFRFLSFSYMFIFLNHRLLCRMLLLFLFILIISAFLRICCLMALPAFPESVDPLLMIFVLYLIPLSSFVYLLVRHESLQRHFRLLALLLPVVGRGIGRDRFDVTHVIDPFRFVIVELDVLHDLHGFHDHTDLVRQKLPQVLFWIKIEWLFFNFINLKSFKIILSGF